MQAWGRREPLKVTSDQSDRLTWKPAARFVSPFDVGGCKKLKLHTGAAECCLSSPRPRLSRDLNRSMRACV